MTKRKYDYILRTCGGDMTSYGGFLWPRKGPVEAPDWDPKPECGNGLHGFLNGAGDGSLAEWRETTNWLVVRIPAGEYMDLTGKVKFQRGEVIFCGSRFEATNLIARFAPEGTAIVGRTFEGKNAIVGYKGTASAADYGTASAGDEGTASAGYRGTASAADYGTASAGDEGTASAGYRGTASAGEEGIIEIEY